MFTTKLNCRKNYSYRTKSEVLDVLEKIQLNNVSMSSRISSSVQERASKTSERALKYAKYIFKDSPKPTGRYAEEEFPPVVITVSSSLVLQTQLLADR